MINFSTISNKSIIGKVLRFPIRFIPKGAVVPILQGRLKGKRWIFGAGDNIAFKEAPKNKILTINKKEDDKINVALVCTSMNQLGGKDAHLINIYMHIDKDRFNVRIVGCSKVENELKTFMLRERVKEEDLILVPRFKKWLLIPFILQLRKVFIANKIDIVHTFQVQSDILGSLAARLAGIKYLISQHESKIIEDNISVVKQFLYKIGNKLIRDWFKKTVVVSDGLKRELISRGFRPSDRIVVIPIGFDIFDKHRDVKFSFDRLKERRPMVGTVSRLSREKGVDRFIAAMPFILEQEPRVEFVIASKGPLEKELKSQVEKLGLMSKVNFTGWVDDIVSLVNSIDIFVMPSIREGCPIALLEALALKRPVVASRIDGIAGIIDDGKNGLLVDTANPREFSKAVLSLCINPERAILMGENGYSKVASELTITREMSRFRDLYNQVLKKE